VAVHNRCTRALTCEDLCKPVMSTRAAASAPGRSPCISSPGMLMFSSFWTSGRTQAPRRLAAGTCPLSARVECILSYVYSLSRRNATGVT
jgi:hypothetical protein